MKIGAYCFNPVKHLKNSSDTHDDLVCIITLIQRFVLLARSIDLIVSKAEALAFTITLVGIICLFSRQIAQLLLFINGRIIHILMNLFFHRKNLLAAERSHTYSSIALDPTYFVIYFAISFDSAIYSIIKPFHLILLVMFVRFLLKAMNIAILYKIKFYIIAIATFIVSAFIFTIYPTFYIPCFLSIHFSPKVLEDDVDLSVLNYRDINIDSSCDGSALLNDLKPMTKDETSFVDSIFKIRDSIKTYHILFMDKRLNSLKPFYNATYYHHQNLPKWASYGKSDTLHNIIDLDLFNRLKPYIMLNFLKDKQLINRNCNQGTINHINNSLQLLTTISKSKLGLVWSISGIVFYNNILIELRPKINSLNTPLNLYALANTIAKYPINVEWLINALRQEAYHSAENFRNEDMQLIINDSLNVLTDSLGYHIPGFLEKKWYDPEETYLITLHTWARIMKKSYYQRQKVKTEELKEISKILSSTTSTWLGVNKLVLYPNSSGRIVASVGIPMYHEYVRDTEDIRRHQEFILLAISLRYYMIKKGRRPESLAQIVSTLQSIRPFELQATYSFDYNRNNNTLTSKDTIPDRDIFSLNL